MPGSREQQHSLAVGELLHVFSLQALRLLRTGMSSFCFVLRQELFLLAAHNHPLHAQSFRNTFAHHIKRFHLEAHLFRPYSLRRGGATALFQQTGSMETALLKGRWSSTKVAKIYLSDGLSFLPGLRFSLKAREMLSQWSPASQLR